MASFSQQEIFDEIDRQAAGFGVDPKMAKALAVAENTGSGSLLKKTVYSGDATSPVGASGIMQVMPKTALGLQQAGYLPTSWKHDPDNLSSQIQAGLGAMKEMTGRMKNPSDINELGAMYNGGTAAWKNYTSGNFAGMPAETQDYLKKLGTATMELGGNNPSAFVAGTPATPGSSMRSGSSNRSTTRTNQYDPVLMDDFLNEVTGMVMPGGSYDTTAQGLAEASMQRQAANADLLAGITSAGQAEGEQAAALATLKAAGDAKRLAILQRLNLDPASTNSEMDAAFANVNSTDSQLRALKPEIDAKMSVGFFDNPLEWLVNQTRLPGMVAQYNSIVGDQNNSIDRYKTLSSIANTQQQLSAATDADKILAAGDAAARVAASTAAVKAATAREANASANAIDLLRQQALDRQRLGDKATAVNMTKQSITESQGESAKAAAAAKEQLDIDNINKIIVAAGGQPISPAQYKGLAPAMKEKLISNASSVKFGKDFAESFEFIRNNGNAGTMAKTGSAGVIPWMQATNALVGDKLKGEMAMSEKLGKKFDSEKAAASAFNDVQNTYRFEAANDMRLASPGNPMKIDYKTVADLPALANNSLAIWLKQYGPGGTEPMMDKVDENRIILKFAQSVREGMPIGEAAKQISQFYPVAAAERQSSTKYEMFGLDKPSSTYKVKINTGTDSVTVDLGNPAQVENALVRRVAYDSSVAATAGWRGLMVLPGVGN